jgi:hypothetical protein
VLYTEPTALLRASAQPNCHIVTFIIIIIVKSLPFTVKPCFYVIVRSTKKLHKIQETLFYGHVAGTIQKLRKIMKNSKCGNIKSVLLRVCVRVCVCVREREAQNYLESAAFG